MRRRLYQHLSKVLHVLLSLAPQCFAETEGPMRQTKTAAQLNSVQGQHAERVRAERHGSKCWAGWADRIPAERWEIYSSVMRAADDRKIPFALAGAFATATHTGRWRDTNDMDLYTLPEHRGAMQEIIESIDDLHDIYDEFPYHRDWTYRATNGKTIVEVIWTMQNHRADVDLPWLQRWGEIEARGVRFFVAPPEEMMWAKLFVLHRLRTDWPDVVHYINVCGPGLDWLHLYDRLGPDYPLLGGVLSVFSWLNPQRVTELPEWVWEKFGIRKPGFNGSSESEEQRWQLLSRCHTGKKETDDPAASHAE